MPPHGIVSRGEGHSSLLRCYGSYCTHTLSWSCVRRRCYPLRRKLTLGWVQVYLSSLAFLVYKGGIRFRMVVTVSLVLSWVDAPLGNSVPRFSALFVSQVQTLCIFLSLGAWLLCRRRQLLSVMRRSVEITETENVIMKPYIYSHSCGGYLYHVTHVFWLLDNYKIISITLYVHKSP